jgi:DNA-binding MarR family transcriptional regulator
MMTNYPTAKLSRVFNYIKNYLEIHRQSPTLREVAVALSMSQPNVQQHVNKLVEMGCVKRKDKHLPRSLSLPAQLPTQTTGKRKRNYDIRLKSRLKEVVAYIKLHKEQHEFAPTLKELADFLNLSPTTIYRYVKILGSQGCLHKTYKVARSVVLAEKHLPNPTEFIIPPSLAYPTSRSSSSPAVAFGRTQEAPVYASPSFTLPVESESPFTETTSREVETEETEALERDLLMEDELDRYRLTLTIIKDRFGADYNLVEDKDIIVFALSMLANADTPVFSIKLNGENVLITPKSFRA